MLTIGFVKVMNGCVTLQLSRVAFSVGWISWVIYFIPLSTMDINCIKTQFISIVGVSFYSIIYRASAEAYPHQVCNNEPQSNRAHRHLPASSRYRFGDPQH